MSLLDLKAIMQQYWNGPWQNQGSYSNLKIDSCWGKSNGKRGLKWQAFRTFCIFLCRRLIRKAKLWKVLPDTKQNFFVAKNLIPCISFAFGHTIGKSKAQLTWCSCLCVKTLLLFFYSAWKTKSVISTLEPSKTPFFFSLSIVCSSNNNYPQVTFWVIQPPPPLPVLFSTAHPKFPLSSYWVVLSRRHSRKFIISISSVRGERERDSS